MRLLSGIVLVAVFLAANVVAAGVVLVLGGLLRRAPALDGSPWAWMAVLAAGAFAAVIFLRGAMSFCGRRDPNKGLESAHGQRGG